jgi:hypothetical protein
MRRKTQKEIVSDHEIGVVIPNDAQDNSLFETVI